MVEKKRERKRVRERESLLVPVIFKVQQIQFSKFICLSVRLKLFIC